jgi:hypothetical protein
MLTCWPASPALGAEPGTEPDICSEIESGAARATSDICVDSPDLRLPSLRLMEPGLPLPCDVDEQGRAVPQPGGQPCPLVPGARVVPEPRWDAIRLQLLDCSEFPGSCRAALDLQDWVWRVILRGSLRAQAARLGVDQVVDAVARSKDWAPWEVYVTVALVVVGALGAGFAAGWLAATFGG